MRYKILLGCLVLSGFCGLAYELLWTRLLSFSFGSTTLSFSVVLAVFFGGLALGAWLAGKKTDSMERPVRAYALIEIATGVFGLLLYPVMLHLDSVFVSIDPGLGLSGALVRLMVATPILIVPTVLMGATLPIVCAAMIYRDEYVGRGTGLIYGFNTLGAFFGAYVVTYHLIPELGIFRSILVTAAVNFVVGAVALVAERGELSEREALAAEAQRAEPAPAPVNRREETGLEETGSSAGMSEESKKILHVATFLTFLSGFAFISFEVVWARLFSSFLEGTVYGVGAVLICFLVGIALGSLLVARFIPSSSAVGLWFAGLQAITVAAVLVICQALPRIAHILHNLAVTRSESLTPQHLQLLVVFAVLLVPTVCSGASFPLLVKIAETQASRTGRALGSLYAANTIGSILGSLLTGFLLIPELGSIGAVSLATALVGLSAALGGALLSTGRRRVAGLGVAAIAMFLVSRYDGFDVRLISLGHVAQKEHYEQYLHRHQTVTRLQVYFAEGRDGTIAVYDDAVARSLKINGLGQGSRVKLPPHHIVESLLVGMIPLVHVESPEQVVVVGLGAGITIDLLREFGVPQITAVEIEPRVIDAVDIIFYGDSPVDAEGVDVVTDDARHYLLLESRQNGRTFDVITSMPAHPWVASSLFTKEFFEIARDSLSPRGVFSSWFGIGKMDQASIESLFRAFCAVFNNYVIYFVPEVGAYYLVGANHPLTVDMDRIRELQGWRSVKEHPTLADPYFLPTRIYATGNEETPQPPPGVVNTDDSAFVEVHAPRSSETAPRLQGFLPDEFLLPSMVPETQRHETFVELMEHLLGSPGGRLPLKQLPIGPKRSRRSLDAAGDILDEQERAYFEGRVAMVSGQMEEARAFFARAQGGDDELARKARKFSALTYPPDSQARLDALLALEPSTDTILEVLEMDWRRALDLVPSISFDPQADPAGWFLSKVATVEPGTLSEADRLIFTRQVGGELAKTSRMGLLGVAERFARDNDLALEAEIFNMARNTLAGKEAGRLFQQGLSAGNQGHYRIAADALWKANRLEPANETTMRLLLISLVEIGDEERVEQLLEEFRFIGRSENHIESLMSDVREGRLVFAENPEAKIKGEAAIDIQ